MKENTGFEPAKLAAPFFERIAAGFVDYSVILLVPIVWLVLMKYVGESGASGGIGTLVWWVAIVVWILNFVLLPLVRGQTVGKMIFGLRILGSNGETPSLLKILFRNTIGYLIVFATAGIGFIIAGVNRSGRSLSDVLFGTYVVKAQRRLIG